MASILVDRLPEPHARTDKHGKSILATPRTQVEQGVRRGLMQAPAEAVVLDAGEGR
jgi:hypothetical protein